MKFTFAQIKFHNFGTNGTCLVACITVWSTHFTFSIQLRTVCVGTVERMQINPNHTK